MRIFIFLEIYIGCCTALDDYFTQYPFSSRDGYIFTGDYFDRGIENVATFKFFNRIVKEPNVLCLIGNHEAHIFNYANDLPVKSKEFINKTAIQFANAGIEKSDLRNFYRKLGVNAYITFRGNDFIISHGGLPCMPKKSIDLLCAENCMGREDYTPLTLATIYGETEKNKIKQK